MSTGTWIFAALRTVVLIVLARLLTPEDFGLVGAALVIVGFSSLFSQLGIGPAIVQRPKLEVEHLRTGFTMSVIFGFILAGLIVLTAPLIAKFFQMQGLVPVIRAVALLFCFQGFVVVADALLRREMRFGWLAGVDVVSYGIGFGVVGISLSLLEFGVWALVCAYLVRSITRAAILLYAQPHPKKPLIDRRSFKELMHFGTGFTVAKVFNYTALQGDNLIVGRWLGATALGLYGRAYQLLVFPINIFGGVLDNVLFPSMAKVQDDPKRLEAAYRRGISLIALIIVPICLAALVLAEEIILVVLGSKWIGVIAPFQILALGMLFRGLTKMDHSVARATGAVYRRAWYQGIFMVFVLGGSLIGQNWGISGVAVGVLIALAVNFTLMTSLSISLTKMTWNRYIIALKPALLMGMITFLEILGLATLLRAFSISNLAVLVVTIAIVSATYSGVIFLKPAILGQDGEWIVNTLKSFSLKKLQGIYKSLGNLWKRMSRLVRRKPNKGNIRLT